MGGGPLNEAPALRVRTLHRLTEVVAQATEPGPIHEASLDALIEALGADRAAILLFDDEPQPPVAAARPRPRAHDGPRFVAWRGLSDAYRRAADGHTPWPRTAVDPRPVLVADVLDEPTLAPLADVILREGIRALAFIPLVTAGRLLGKFMIYYDTPHVFTDDEVDVAQAVAAQVAFAIERGRLESELRLANGALAATLDAVGDGITVQAPDGSLLFANDEAAAMLGYPSPADLLAAGPAAVRERFTVYDEDGAPVPVADLPGRLALGGVEGRERLLRWRTGDTERWSVVSARPVLAEDGTVRFAVNVFRDVTERQRVVEALHASERRLAFLASTSRDLLGSAVDYQRVLEHIADLFVPAVADLGVVRELEVDGTVRREAVRHNGHRDPGAIAALDLRPDPVEPARAEVATGGRAIVVPLRAQDRTIASVTLVRAPGSRPYDDGDVALVDELCRRATLALQNARLYEEKSTVAETLQRALLPPVLPEIPGLELAACYRAAASEIGGDFYDVVPVGPSRWMIAVGDVCGKGIEAASLTAMVRYTLRAFAPAASGPSELLARLNDALLPQLATDRFCTVACGFLETDGGGAGAALTISLGGHPRPLRVTPEGEVRPVGVAGTLLGTLPSPALADERVDLRPGDALVIFTDGCLGENPTGQDHDRLARVLAGDTASGAAAPATAKHLAEAVEMAARAELDRADDLTVLACRRLP
jgi:PAS domain S-box-containing protein